MMSARSLLAALAAALLLAAVPATARAAWFPAETIDGPSPDIVAFGDVDLARDGTGGLVYVKIDGGVPHIFVSRQEAGAWRAPERVDTGMDSGASEPAIAAGDNNRLAIVWISAGRLFGVATSEGPLQALPAPALLHAPENGLESVRAPSLDLGINGTAYATFTAPGPSGTDVRAVRLQNTTWEALPGPLDINVEQPAGVGAGRSRVAVSAEGNAVAAWGEAHPDGRSHVYARRLFGLALSVAPQEISLPELEGAAGGTADSVDIDIEDDNSYAWAVFRQDFGGRSRALARRLVGSLFEPPTAIDGGGPAATPRVGMSGRGVGISAVDTAGAVQVALIEKDIFGQTFRVDSLGSARPTIPVATTSEREESVMVWRSANGGDTEVRGRHRPEAKAFSPETLLSTPAFGPAATDGLEVTEDRLGDFAAGFLQGPLEARRVVAAVFDRPPGRPMGLSSSKPRKAKDLRLVWRPGSDLWGPQTFKVLVDNAEVGTTTEESFVPPTQVTDGAHSWQVISVDRRGQQSPSLVRTVRVDGTPPSLRVRVTGRRRSGLPITVRAVARDPRPGYGLKHVKVDWGDGTPNVRGALTRHFYRSGRFTLTVKAVDRTRNVTIRRYSLRIKK